jgi:HSP20 family protein
MVTSPLKFPGDVFAEFDELQRSLERLFGMRSRSSSIRAVGAGSFPPINIGVTSDAVEIFAFTPGVDASSLDVTVDRGLLTIAGERKDDLQGAGVDQRTVYAHERPSGSFRRVVSLPQDADPARVQADYRDGVLRVRVEKHETSRPRRIEITDAR